MHPWRTWPVMPPGCRLPHSKVYVFKCRNCTPPVFSDPLSRFSGLLWAAFLRLSSCMLATCDLLLSWRTLSLKVLCMWLTCPLNLIQGCIGGLCRQAL